MTLVVCPNLAVDRLLRLPRLRAGTTMRAQCLRQQAGGKGANVVRVLRALGGDGLLIGFAAGHTGRLVAELAHDEGLQFEFVTLAGETRISVVMLEEHGRRTDVFEYGPSIEPADESALAEALRGRPAEQGEWAVLTGSSPPGASPGFYAALVLALRDSGYRVLADAAEEQLRGCLADRPDLVKVNLSEAAGVLGASGTGLVAAKAACAGLVGLGAGAAIVTRGAGGAVGLSGGVSFSVRTPPVQTVNSVGSGDCFAAALVLELERGADLISAVPLAAGAGAANATTLGTAEVDPALARELAAAATLRIAAA